MRAIKTYNDYIDAASKGEKEKIAFMLAAIAEHKNSVQYKIAADAELYYDGENPTINKYEKILYDMQGKAHVDMWTANHKIASHFFGLAVDQENFYLLGNGVTLQKAENKDKLGTKASPFDRSVTEVVNDMAKPRKRRKKKKGGLSYIDDRWCDRASWF